MADPADDGNVSHNLALVNVEQIGFVLLVALTPEFQNQTVVPGKEDVINLPSLILFFSLVKFK